MLIINIISNKKSHFKDIILQNLKCEKKMILISLLGKFDSAIFPIFFEFKNDITKHIIIHDDSRYETTKTQKIIEAQEKFKEFYSLNYEVFSIKIDEDSYLDILSCYEKIVELSNNKVEEVYFNGTGGLVSSTIILSNKLLDKGANFIAYDIFDNGYNIVSKDSMQKKKITQNKDINSHFLLKGYETLSTGSKIEAFKRKKEVLKICENIENLQEFAIQIQNKNHDEIRGFSNIKESLFKIEKLEDKMFIQGTIFEEYIYWLLEDNFNFDQVMFNVKVQFDENLMNEFDILMMKDNHLHVIECKLRKSVPGEQYVYKLDSVIDYLDDDGKGMLLVIGGENHQFTSSGNSKTSFTNGTISRANNANIKVHHFKTFNKQRFIDDIKTHFLD